jgi:hypothetical protein
MAEEAGKSDSMVLASGEGLGAVLSYGKRQKGKGACNTEKAWGPNLSFYQ